MLRVTTVGVNPATNDVVIKDMSINELGIFQEKKLSRSEPICKIVRQDESSFLRSTSGLEIFWSIRSSQE